MNCKPGDLAVLIKADPSMTANIGTLVTVIKLLEGTEWCVRLEQSALVSNSGGTYRAGPGHEVTCPDSYLRPIRPQPDDAVDEMVLRVGKPSEVTA